MTIITDRDRTTEAPSLSSALARIAAVRTATGPGSASPYSAVTVRMTISNGKVTGVVAV